MQRLERGFGCSAVGADTKRETRAMDPPVVRVQVGVENLQRGLGLKGEPVDRSVVVQPAANGLQIGAAQLPFHFAPVFGERRVYGRDRCHLHDSSLTAMAARLRSNLQGDKWET